MDAKRRQHVVLAALMAVLAVVLWWNTGERAEPAATKSRSAATAATDDNASARVEVPVVAMNLLTAGRSEPVDTGRDPFRFGSRRTTEETGGAPAGGGPAAGRGPARPMPPPAVDSGPPVPPPPPPIPLKFIGVVERPGNVRIAVLSDAQGVYHGREGDVIEGRYKIVRIGADTVEMMYVDGRGRQQIRLSGA
jgi:hypothetical protein